MAPPAPTAPVARGFSIACSALVGVLPACSDWDGLVKCFDGGCAEAECPANLLQAAEFESDVSSWSGTYDQATQHYADLALAPGQGRHGDAVLVCENGAMD